MALIGIHESYGVCWSNQRCQRHFVLSEEPGFEEVPPLNNRGNNWEFEGFLIGIHGSPKTYIVRSFFNGKYITWFLGGPKPSCFHGLLGGLWIAIW